ncbi:MAG TPA: hypothetical protein VIT43_12250 [Candidatus Dormibacteraeota bacterium]
MASQPAMSSPRITIGRIHGNSRGNALLLWVPACVAGAAVGAIVAAEVRTLGASTNSNATIEALRYLATIASAAIAAAAQWWVLRRARLDAYWWVPGTVAAQLLATILLIPSVLRLFLPVSTFQSFNPSLAQAMVIGGVALAAGGLLVGGAQAFILRKSVGRSAWLWVPASMVGGALAGSVTSALSSHFLMLAPLVAVGLAAATGSVLVAASQLVVLIRLVR